MGIIHYLHILDYFYNLIYYRLFGNKLIKSTISYSQFHIIYYVFYFDLNFIV